MKPLTVSSEELMDVLYKDINKGTDFNLDAGYYLTDSTYAVPELTHMKTQVYNCFTKWLTFLGLDRKTGQKQFWKRKFDCENLASLYKSYCDLLHYKTNPLSFEENFKAKKRNKSDAEGLAVGTIWYDNSTAPNSKNLHAINAIITQKPGQQKLSVIYIEPNNGSQLSLTKKQKESIWYAKF
tara:strand:- start:198 stop:743 length:546 start_codon:yes stop_codon:yes gene_type:complete